MDLPPSVVRSDYIRYWLRTLVRRNSTCVLPQRRLHILVGRRAHAGKPEIKGAVLTCSRIVWDGDHALSL